MTTRVETLGEFRIGEGGLLRRFETAARLTRLRWQIVWALAVTWVPVVVLGLLGTRVDGRIDPIVRDGAVHVRLLVAVPAFLFLDQVFPLACRSVLKQLTEQSFVPVMAKPRFDRLLQRATRLGDSAVPEVVLAVLAVCLGSGAFLGIVPARGVPRGGDLSHAQAWYALTAVPLFQFLLWRSLWRWALWARLLAGLSRIDLDLVAPHPDRRGGIGFLRLPSIGYCAMLLFAISSVLCAEWRPRFTIDATLMSFVPLLLLLAVLGMVIAFGPLLPFSLHLGRARRDGLIELGDLAADCGRRFRRRWLAGGERRDLLGSGDVSALADLAPVYRETVERLRFVLFDRRDVVLLLAATLSPVVLLMIASVPAEDWFAVVRLLLGGGLP
jgi:hypothetical protein